MFRPVAGALAGALKAEKLILMTDVPGIQDAEGELVSSVSFESIDVMLKEGVIQGGMIPKVKAAMDALREGVSKIHIINGRIEHSVLLEIFTQTGIGTEIIQ